MDTKQIIDAVGGRSKVLKLTGLTKGRISQWESTNHIPRAWHLLFHEMHPRKIPHPDKASGRIRAEPPRTKPECTVSEAIPGRSRV